MTAFADNLRGAVDAARLDHGALHAYASPRRLGVLIEGLAARQEDRTSTQKGPPVAIAYDEEGNLTAAGAAFARKCGVDESALGRTGSDKGEWLSCEVTEAGAAADTLLPELVDKALSSLPIPRRMRWGAGEAEFVRPVHWVVMLHGSGVVDATILGIRSGNSTRGHRFHSEGPITIAAPSAYLETLEREGRVIADFERRRELVRDGVEAQAKAAGGHAVGSEELYDEVAALVEWPVPITGSFDDEYLRLPREVVVSTLAGHQRYFPVADADGALLPRFITVANLESKDPDQVRDGNERVIRPRLADAAFFWESDRRTTLAARREALREVVYQRGLGSLFDKSARTASLCAQLAADLEIDGGNAERAAALCKCDLLTGMVGEFPELQGTMGRYYAETDGETAEVAAAIGDHYLPRFAGDTLPAARDGQVLAVADKVDTLAGVFSIGKRPTGNRDPFGLRRAALGIVRISIECELDFDLSALIAAAVAAQPEGKFDADEIADELYAFVTDRLRGYFLDRDADLAVETFEAVLARRPASLVDFAARLGAVHDFRQLEPAASLAAANKRIANILKKSAGPGAEPVNEDRLAEPAEKALWTALNSAREEVLPLVGRRDYGGALAALAGLRAPVDAFFDDVMVMTDDEKTRTNRLALLDELRALFLEIADISRLSI
jgi:glycyl-tRNA synthetase beta chain